MLRLKELRNEKALTQKELAEFLEVSRSMIAMWETGRNTPDYMTLKKMSDFFNVTIDYLLGRSKTYTYKNNENIQDAIMSYQVMRECQAGFSLVKEIHGNNITQREQSELDYLQEDYLENKDCFDRIYGELSEEEKNFVDLFIHTTMPVFYNHLETRFYHKNLKKKEFQLIVKIRTLDDRGKQAVFETIEREFKFTKLSKSKYKINKKDFTNITDKQSEIDEIFPKTPHQTNENTNDFE